MRKTTRRIVWMLIFGALIYFGRSMWLPFLKETFHLSTTPYDETTRAFVYRLDLRKPLEFSFPPASGLKMIINALAPGDFRPGPGESFSYAVHYDLLDSGGSVLLSKTYHQSATLAQYRGHHGRESLVTGFLEGSRETPMDGKIIIIDFKNTPGVPRQLRIRLEPLEKPLTGALVRLYWRREFQSHRLPVIWKRLSMETKTNLAKGNIYPVQLLNETEKRNLASVKWEVAAPEGVPGTDFQRLTLYKLKHINGTLIYPFDKWSQISSGALYVRPGLHGTVPLPLNGGRFRLRCFAIDQNKATPESKTAVHMTWYGPRAGEYFSFSIPWTPPSAALEKELNGGLLEIRSPAEITVHIEQLTSKGSVEIIPFSMFVQSYRCDMDTPVLYTIYRPRRVPSKLTPESPGRRSHWNHTFASRAIFFRFDLRRLFPPGTGQIGETFSGSDAYVKCQLLTTGRDIIKEFSLKAGAIPAVYDREPKDTFILSDKTSYYFRLSPNVAFVRFARASAPVTVTAYNRPSGLVSPARVPEDRFAYNRDLSARRDWFFVQPDRAEQLEETGRSVPLLLQYRPPQLDENIAAGHYLGESLVPSGPVPGRLLLVKRDSFIPVGETARAGMFRPLKPGSEVSLRFIPLPGQAPATARTSPRLLFVNPGANTVPARLLVDGNVHWSGTLRGGSNEILLDPVTPGIHIIRVESESQVAFYIDCTDAASPPYFHRRLVYRVSNRPTVFPYTREYPVESIYMKLFSPYGSQKRIQFEATLTPTPNRFPVHSADQPFSTFTLLKRRYSVKPADGPPVPVLQSRDGPVDSGNDIYITLDQDIPPGNYLISIRLLDVSTETDCYLSLSRVVPGEFEENRFFIEETGPNAMNRKPAND